MKPIILIIIFTMTMLLSCTQNKDLLPAGTVQPITADDPASETDKPNRTDMPASETDMFPVGAVHPVRDASNETDQSERIEIASMKVTQEGETVAIDIHYEGVAEAYWRFKLKNIRRENHIVTADLDSSISMDSCPQGTSYPNVCWGYSDSNARGVFTFDRHTGIATLDFYFHIYHDEIHHVIRWRALPV